MPLYAYRCPNCGAIRDSFAKVEDRTVVLECAQIEGSEPWVCQFERIPSAPTVIIPQRHKAA